MKRSYFLLLFIICGWYSQSSAKIYDCFLFFNELELLTIRLHELYEHVDKFVIVESAETFRGNPKPFYFDENKHLFEKFSDKIIHIKVYDCLKTNNPWDREIFQRNQIMRGLIACAPDDIILISDADEIICPFKLLEISETLRKISSNDLPMLLCYQTMYRYFFNRLDSEYGFWPGTTAIFFKDLEKYSPNVCRNFGQQKLLTKIENAGWHFTYMGGYKRVIEKLAAFSHAECDTPGNKDIKNLEKKISTFTLVEIDNSYPHLIYNNQLEYISKGFIDVQK